MFENDKFHGEGELLLVDGSSYKGYWKNGLKHGPGEMVYLGNHKYVGCWHNDLRHDNDGILTWHHNKNENNCYKGAFVNDKRTGFATYTK